jgi:hypothetical protein
MKGEHVRWTMRCAIAVGFLLASCAHRTAVSVAGQAGTAGAAPVVDRWSALSWEERHDRMTWLVHPTMAKLFQRFQQSPYPTLTCRTCHGADAEQVQYKMPHGLPALDPAHLPNPNGGGAKARIAKFMVDEVTPQMAELLEVDPYDLKTGRGFGCFGCHPASRSGGLDP